RMPALLRSSRVRQFSQLAKSRVGLGIEFADNFDEFAECLEVSFASLNFLVDDNAVETLFGWVAKQLLSQCQMLLCGESEPLNDSLHFHLSVFNSFGNLDLLFARKQRNLPHLLQIHPNRIIEDIQSTLLVLFFRFRLLYPIDLCLVDYFDLE